MSTGSAHPGRPELSFVRLAAADLPLLASWLRAPHVARWFGDADQWVEEIRGQLEVDWVSYAIAELDGKSVGFVQAYRTERAPAGLWSAQPAGTIGIDFLLGRPRDLGLGLGRALVAQWSAWCDSRLGATRLIADPDPCNEPSVRALEGSGFVLDEVSGLFVREARAC